MKKNIIMLFILVILLTGCNFSKTVDYEDLDTYVSVQDYNGEYMSFERYINNDVYGHEDEAFPAIESCISNVYGYDMTAEAIATYQTKSAIVYATMDEPIKFTTRIITTPASNFGVCESFSFDMRGDVNSGIYASAYEDTLIELDNELEKIKEEYGLVSRNEGTFTTGSNGYQTENYFIANDLSDDDLYMEFEPDNYDLTPEYILEHFEGTQNEELAIAIHLFEDTPGVTPSKEEADEIITRLTDKFGTDRLEFRVILYPNEVVLVNGTGHDSVWGEIEGGNNNE